MPRQPRVAALLTILVFMCLMSGTSLAAIINSATVAGNQCIIGGSGFSGTLTVTLNGKKLTIVSSTSTQIMASLGNAPPAAGSYRLVVKAGTASTFAYVTIPAAPKVVTQVSLVGQTSLIPTTTLATPSADTSFRVSVYLVQDNSTSAQCLNFPTGCGYAIANLFWTDNGGPQSNGGFGINLASCATVPSACQAHSMVYTVRVNAGTPLAFSITGEYVASSYDLFVSVEQLE